MNEGMPGAPKRRKWPMQFTVRTLLLMMIPVAFVAYLLKPGNLTPGNVNITFSLDRFFFETDPVLGERFLYISITVTNKSGNTLWYEGYSDNRPVHVEVQSVDDLLLWYDNRDPNGNRVPIKNVWYDNAGPGGNRVPIKAGETITIKYDIVKGRQIVQNQNDICVMLVWCHK